MTLENRIPPPLVFLATAVVMALIAWMTPRLEASLGLRLALALIPFLLAGYFGPLAIRLFARRKTTINPVRIDAVSSLVSDGPYRLSRNPMYLSMALLLFAWAIVLAAPWTLVGPAFFVIFITRFQIIPEERVLEARFPQAYAEYRARVRRWI